MVAKNIFVSCLKKAKVQKFLQYCKQFAPRTITNKANFQHLQGNGSFVITRN